MASEFDVTYRIKVLTGNSVQNISRFVEAVDKLPAALKAFQEAKATLSSSFSKPLTLTIQTKTAMQNLQHVQRRLGAIQQQLHAINRSTGSLAGVAHAASNAGKTGGGKNNVLTGKGGSSKGGSSKGGSSKGGSGGVGKSAGGSTNTAPPKGLPYNPGNYAYKALGPSAYQPTNIAAFDMLKGMGIMYGITGLGSMMGNVIRDSSEYDNLMQTTKNILSVHDPNKSTFDSRFAAMSQTIRDVGVSTKFTAPEVADAAKFLAMAGYTIEDINASIRPIADMALIGDTDLGSTADVVTNIMKSYDIQSSQMRNAVDVMTMTSTSANVTLMHLAESFQYAGSVLHNADVSFEMANAMLGVLGNAGRQGSMGGTDLRMIVRNMLNPTTKQAATWKAMGISPTDENGQLRPLNQVFRELHDKNILPSTVGNLFRVTASAGATQLIKDVDTIDEILRRNYAAEGVSRTLAEAKKNTVQGLWAQVTSQFTEDGLQSFEGMQGQIRGFMRELLAWLKTTQAKMALSQFASLILDVMKYIKEFTLSIIKLYQQIAPLIKFWMQLQLVLAPIVITLKALRSGFALLMYAMAKGYQLSRLVLGFQTLLNTLTYGQGVMKAWTAAQAAYNGVAAETAAINTTVAATGATVATGAAGSAAQTAPAVAAVPGKWAMGASVLGGAAGAYLGYKVATDMGADDYSLTSILSGGVGAVAGTALVSMAAPYMASLFGLSSIPVGGWIAAAIVAAGGLAAYMASTADESKRAAQNIQQMTNELKVTDGIYGGEGATNAAKWLQLVHDKTLSLVELQRERVRLIREEMGLPSVDAGNSETRAKNISNDTLRAAFKDLEAASSWVDRAWSGDDNMLPTAIAKLDKVMGKRNPLRVDQASDGSMYYYWNNTRIDRDDVKPLTALALEGAMGAEQIQAQGQVLAQLQAYAKTNATYDQYANLLSSIIQSYQHKYNADTEPGLKFNGSSISGVGTDDWTGANTLNTYAYNDALRVTLQTAFADVLPTIKTYLDSKAAGTLTEQQIMAFMGVINPETAANLQGYYTKNPQEFLRTQFGIVDGVMKVVDGSTQTLQQQAEGTKYSMGLVEKSITDMGLSSTPAAQRILALINYINALANTAISGGGVTPGSSRAGYKGASGHEWHTDDVVWKNNVKYQRNQHGQFVPVYGDKNLMLSTDEIEAGLANGTANFTGKPVSSSNKGNHDNKDNPTNTFAPPPKSSKKRGSGGGANSSAYKNHYNNHSAAPKQINVRIENLMNVKSIDMSKSDNREVLENLRAQLAQTLIDVVHDFDASWGGTTTV